MPEKGIKSVTSDTKLATGPRKRLRLWGKPEQRSMRGDYKKQKIPHSRDNLTICKAVKPAAQSKALKLRPAARLKLFEHEQSIVYDCDVRKASFNAPLGDAVAERKGFEPLCLLGKRFSRLFGYSEVKVS